MSRCTRLLFLVLTVFFSAWSGFALPGSPAIRESWATLGISYPMGTAIAGLELLAAVGLALGQRWARLGFAAAAGLVAMMAGAVASHLRVGDVVGAHGSVVIGLVSLGAAASVWADMRAARRPAPAPAGSPVLPAVRMATWFPVTTVTATGVPAVAWRAA